jgi:hypothetical protein
MQSCFRVLETCDLLGCQLVGEVSPAGRVVVVRSHGLTPGQPVDVLAHVLLAAADETALFIASAPDQPEARDQGVQALIATVVTTPDLPGAACVDHLDVFDACTDRGATFACDEAIQICASQCPAAAIAADRAEVEADASSLSEAIRAAGQAARRGAGDRGVVNAARPATGTPTRMAVRPTHHNARQGLPDRVYPDDLVEPADGTADQRAY